jgi:hypothetical protein
MTYSRGSTNVPNPQAFHAPRQYGSSCSADYDRMWSAMTADPYVRHNYARPYRRKETMSLYPVLVRNQYHDCHDYTLRLADWCEVRLTEHQVQSLGRQIERDQTPMSEAELAVLKAELGGICAKRLT